ncbi:ATP-binding cassette domain-containing protein (plasmid) [Devosia sp. A8/3-2]|nr:ATP-binding cassette domain-containing protein [Devosia sp. A8/3-2]
MRSGLFARKASHVAVNAIDPELAPQERIGVVGESGSGKSTLGRLLLGLTQPTLGEVRFEGVEHRDRRPQDWSRFRMQTSPVQQNPLSALNPQMTIGEQVAEAVWVHRVADRNGARERAAAMLERVGLSSAMMSRFPHQMSGGQRQRVVIARFDPATQAGCVRRGRFGSGRIGAGASGFDPEVALAGVGLGLCLYHA